MNYLSVPIRREKLYKQIKKTYVIYNKPTLNMKTKNKFEAKQTSEQKIIRYEEGHHIIIKE